MSTENETIADIVAEMHQLSETTQDGIISIKGNVIADRIMDAWKREKSQSWHHSEMEELILRHEKEVAELKKQIGNSAAMRSCLLKILAEMTDLGGMECGRKACFSPDAIANEIREALAVQPEVGSDEWKNTCEKCMDGDIEPSYCEYYGEPNGCNSPIYGEHPTTEKSSSVGNAAAMRKAFDDILEKIDKWRTDGLMEHWQYSQLFDIADAALAAPLRNCDAGTPEEQVKRHKEWCDRNVCELTYSCRVCFAKWEQMPYESEAANASDS